MLTRAITLVILLATRLAAADSDLRAGFWEGTTERGRGIERIVFLLTISVHGMDGPHPVTDAVARVESGAGLCGANQVQLEPDSVSFDCRTIDQRAGTEPAGGHFEGHFSPQSSLVLGTWRGKPVQLTRPTRYTSDADWVAEAAGQTCVVRFFDEPRRATIDIYSKEQAVFGRKLDSYTSPAVRFNFGWKDTDKNLFAGSISADKSELVGIWQGHDFLCATLNYKSQITFHWTRSSL